MSHRPFISVLQMQVLDEYFEALKRPIDVMKIDIEARAAPEYVPSACLRVSDNERAVASMAG